VTGVLRLAAGAVRGSVHPLDAARELGPARWRRRRRGGPARDHAGPALVLSPHFDDAVLSCWSALAAPGDVLVANVFTGRPAPGVLADYDRIAGASSSAELMAAREAEDADALALAGRRAVNLGFLENQYRSRAPAVSELLDRLAARVPGARSVLAPAAIGLHPDHVLARNVALALRARGWPVTFYADLPYCATYGWPSWVTGAPADPRLVVDAHWTPALEVLRREGIEPVAQVRRLDASQQAAKLAALRGYATQYPTLTRGPLDVLARPAVLGFEVTWTAA
jgi:LmbE family N-acetylglucosaminyl deacetylase